MPDVGIQAVETSFGCGDGENGLCRPRGWVVGVTAAPVVGGVGGVVVGVTGVDVGVGAGGNSSSGVVVVGVVDVVAVVGGGFGGDDETAVVAVRWP